MVYLVIDTSQQSVIPVRLQICSFFSHLYSISLFVSLCAFALIEIAINQRIEFHRSYLFRSLGPWISSTESTHYFPTSNQLLSCLCINNIFDCAFVQVFTCSIAQSKSNNICTLPSQTISITKDCAFAFHLHLRFAAFILSQVN